jgi:hypothetical protein
MGMTGMIGPGWLPITVQRAFVIVKVNSRLDSGPISMAWWTALSGIDMPSGMTFSSTVDSSGVIFCLHSMQRHRFVF